MTGCGGVGSRIGQIVRRMCVRRRGRGSLHVTGSTLRAGSGGRSKRWQTRGRLPSFLSERYRPYRPSSEARGQDHTVRSPVRLSERVHSRQRHCRLATLYLLLFEKNHRNQRLARFRAHTIPRLGVDLSENGQAKPVITCSVTGQRMAHGHATRPHTAPHITHDSDWANSPAHGVGIAVKMTGVGAHPRVVGGGRAAGPPIGA